MINELIKEMDLEKTVECLDKASAYLSDISGKGKKILFVGCKRQAQEAVKEAAGAAGQFFVNHRWLGGTLTNLSTIRRSVERLKYLEDIEKQTWMVFAIWRSFLTQS